MSGRLLIWALPRSRPCPARRGSEPAQDLRIAAERAVRSVPLAARLGIASGHGALRLVGPRSVGGSHRSGLDRRIQCGPNAWDVDIGCFFAATGNAIRGAVHGFAGERGELQFLRRAAQVKGCSGCHRGALRIGEGSTARDRQAHKQKAESVLGHRFSIGKAHINLLAQCVLIQDRRTFKLLSAIAQTRSSAGACAVTNANSMWQRARAAHGSLDLPRDRVVCPNARRSCDRLSQRRRKPVGGGR